MDLIHMKRLLQVKKRFLAKYLSESEAKIDEIERQVSQMTVQGISDEIKELEHRIEIQELELAFQIQMLEELAQYETVEPDTPPVLEPCVTSSHEVKKPIESQISEVTDEADVIQVESDLVHAPQPDNQVELFEVLEIDAKLEEIIPIQEPLLIKCVSAETLDHDYFETMTLETESDENAKGSDLDSHGLGTKIFGNKVEANNCLSTEHVNHDDVSSTDDPTPDEPPASPGDLMIQDKECKILPSSRQEHLPVREYFDFELNMSDKSGDKPTDSCPQDMVTDEVDNLKLDTVNSSKNVTIDKEVQPLHKLLEVLSEDELTGLRAEPNGDQKV